MAAAWESGWADPRRLHAEGRRASRLLDDARAALADGLGVRPQELSFTPGGPAALRLGLTGLQYAARRTGARLVTSAVEHSAILHDGRYAAGQAGDPLRHAEVEVDALARVDLDAWAEALAVPGTAVAALAAANGEVGTRQPLAAAHEQCRRRGIPLMVDALATLGRDPVPTEFDVLAGDARSWGGPSGVGVLIVPARTRWRRDAPPSELEAGRVDIEPVLPLVLGAAEAWRQQADTWQRDARQAHALIERVRVAVAAIADSDLPGDPDDRLPHVLTCSFLLADGEALVTELDRRGFAVASGSACTASTLEPSHVLAAMGALTHGNIRLTLPLQAVYPGVDRSADVEDFAAALPDAVAAVRAQLAGR
ncbi:MAG: aminotransferase class V-fold PLP-dependent enzyme [Actinomycetales bacterium]|nr:aminotransferase class V-fold PLP-dependent enzyme [Actinomycetales bacterium]